MEGIPNERPRHLPRSLVHVAHLFHHCFRLCLFTASWKPKPGKNWKFPPNLLPINLLSITGKFFEKVILRRIHRHIKERNLLNASQFGFSASRHFNVWLTDHVTLSFNNNTSTAAVFLDIEKAIDTIWHPGLLHKLSELQFLESLLKLIAFFLHDRKFKVSLEDKFSSPRKVAAGVPLGSVRAPVLYSLCIHDASAATEIHLALFADDTCM
jgi:hypothetical protein